MQILLTFTGFHDPYSKGLIAEEDQPGPILSLLRVRNFDAIYLLTTPNTEANTAGTLRALDAHPAVQRIDVPLNDPTDYAAILGHLRAITQEIVDRHPGAEYFISVASGTPQMHACWVLLAASGEFAARILHVRPPRFVTAQAPQVSEVDVTGSHFPLVRARPFPLEEDGDRRLDPQKVLTELGLVGDHPKLLAALDMASTLAPSTAAILILGATGTGKELVAQFVHRMSGRPADRFVALNCAAIPKDLAESVLFGHRKGSFTGATSDQIGKLEQADGGTLFLDELGELSMAAQAKLLRVLEDGLVEPIGVRKPKKVDVRVIAATNQNLSKAIQRNEFREDLYYRLNVGEIKLSPLRDRRSDIPKLALHILDRINTGLKRPKRLSQAALIRLQAQPWPGNVRDLRNVIERSARLTTSDVIDADDLLISEPVVKEDPLNFLPEPTEGFSIEDFLSSARKQLILRAIESAKGNQSEAARLLGVSPQAIHKFVLQLRNER